MDGMQAEAGRPEEKYDLAGKVIGLPMKVHSSLGPGLLVNYLTATGLETGLPLNFGAPRLEFRKMYRTYRPPVRHSGDSVRASRP